MTSMQDTPDEGNGRRGQRKAEWARRVIELYGSNELTREIASARTTNLGATLAVEAHSFLILEAVRASLRAHPDWCQRDNRQHHSPANPLGWAHVGQHQCVLAKTHPRRADGLRPQVVTRPVIDDASHTPVAELTLHTATGAASLNLSGQECVDLIGHLLEMVDALGADLGVTE